MNAPFETRMLLVETSGRIGLVGLADGDALRAERRLDATRRHARDLAPAVKVMLEQANWKPADITAVAVSRGPGSYTGLRVGIMSAKAFAYAAGCRLLAIDTFAIIAAQAGPGSEAEVIADGQQERIYAQRFQLDGPSGPTAVSTLRILPVIEWLTELPRQVRVTGPGLGPVSQRLPEEQPRLPEGEWEPRLDSLHRLALERLARGETDDIWRVEPLYARPSSAEEKWTQMGR